MTLGEDFHFAALVYVWPFDLEGATENNLMRMPRRPWIFEDAGGKFRLQYGRLRIELS